MPNFPFRLVLGAALAAFLATRPAAQSGQSPEIPVPVRIAKAEVGEWALYRLADGDRMRLTVIARYGEGRKETVVLENRLMDRKNKTRSVREEEINVHDAVWDLTHLGPNDRVESAEVMVNGQIMRAVVVTFYENGVPVVQSFLSDRIPVQGIIRGLRPQEEDNLAMQLLDYGFAGDREDDP